MRPALWNTQCQVLADIATLCNCIPSPLLEKLCLWPLKPVAWRRALFSMLPARVLCLCFVAFRDKIEEVGMLSKLALARSGVWYCYKSSQSKSTPLPVRSFTCLSTSA